MSSEIPSGLGSATNQPLFCNRPRLGLSCIGINAGNQLPGEFPLFFQVDVASNEVFRESPAAKSSPQDVSHTGKGNRREPNRHRAVRVGREPRVERGENFRIPDSTS